MIAAALLLAGGLVLAACLCALALIAGAALGRANEGEGE